MLRLLVLAVAVAVLRSRLVVALHELQDQQPCVRVADEAEPARLQLPVPVLVPVLVLRGLVGCALSTAFPDGLLLNNRAHTGARLPKCPCGPAAFVRARKKKTAVRIAYTMVRSRMVPKRRKKVMVHPYITAPVAAVVSAAAKMGGPMRVMASRDLSWRRGAEEAW